jgi:hypothetical protein
MAELSFAVSLNVYQNQHCVTKQQLNIDLNHILIDAVDKRLSQRK